MICPHCGEEIVSTADVAIEWYYRSRAAGSKITLKQVAERYNLSHDYLRQAKSAYDKAGRAGRYAGAQGTGGTDRGVGDIGGMKHLFNVESVPGTPRDMSDSSFKPVGTIMVALSQRRRLTIVESTVEINAEFESEEQFLQVLITFLRMNGYTVIQE